MEIEIYLLLTVAETRHETSLLTVMHVHIFSPRLSLVLISHIFLIEKSVTSRYEIEYLYLTVRVDYAHYWIVC